MASGSGSRSISGGRRAPLPAPLSEGDGERETLPETPWYDLPIQNVASGGFTPPFFPEGDYHGTLKGLNLAKIWGNNICVGMDSQSTNALTNEVSSYERVKFHQLTDNIYMTAVGSAAVFNLVFDTLSTMVKTSPRSDRTVFEIAYHFSNHVIPAGQFPAQSLVMGWDNNNVSPQMYCVSTWDKNIIKGHTFAIGSGANHISIEHLSVHEYDQLGHVVHDTMSLLTRAAMLDPYCGGEVLGRILKKDTPPKVCYKNHFGP